MQYKKLYSFYNKINEIIIFMRVLRKIKSIPLFLLTIFDLVVAFIYLSQSPDKRYFSIWISLFAFTLFIALINELIRKRKGFVLLLEAIVTPTKLVFLSYFINSLNFNKEGDAWLTFWTLFLAIIDFVFTAIEIIRTNKISKPNINVGKERSAEISLVSFMFSGFFILAVLVFSLLLGFSTFYDQLIYVLPYLIIPFIISLISIKVAKRSDFAFIFYRIFSLIILIISLYLLGFNTRTDFFEFNILIYSFVALSNILHCLGCIFSPHNFAEISNENTPSEEK